MTIELCGNSLQYDGTPRWTGKHDTTPCWKGAGIGKTRRYVYEKRALRDNWVALSSSQDQRPKTRQGSHVKKEKTSINGNRTRGGGKRRPGRARMANGTTGTVNWH